MSSWRVWEAVVRLLVTAAVMIVSWQSSWTGVDPAQWDDLLVGLGLRPADGVSSVWWCWIVRTMSERMTTAELMQTQHLAGTVGIGILTFQVFGLLALLLPFGQWVDLRARSFGRVIVNLVLTLGTLSFVSSDVVWKASRGLGAPLIDDIVLLGVVRLVCGFLIQGGSWRVVIAAPLLGWMAGHGIFGLVAFLVLWILVLYVAFSNPGAKVNPLYDVSVRRRLVFSMVGLFALTAVTLLIFGYRWYYAFGGVRKSAFFLVDLVHLIGGDVFHGVQSAISPFGWLFVVFFVAGPAVLTYRALQGLMGSDRLPSRRFVLMLVLSGLVAWMQLAPFPWLWWQGKLSAVCVRSEFAQLVIVLLNTVTLVWAFDIFLQVSVFLNFRQVVGYQYEDASAEKVAVRAVGAMTRFNRCQRVLALAMLTGALCVVWPFGRHLTFARVWSVIDDYCREVARECATVSVLLTDGALDSGVELAAAIEGRRLVAVSMLSGFGPHDVAVRQRAAVDKREKDLLEQGPVWALRYWRDEETDRLADVALQFGFVRNVTEAERKATVLSGLVGLPDGSDRAIAAASTERSRRLGERIVDICRTENLDGLMGGLLTDLFRFVQWRVAQMCRVRTEYASEGTWGEGERRDESLASRLDDCNPFLGAPKGRVEGFQEIGDLRLTPEEGLRIALQRADFRLAKMFAETVFRRNPKDVYANFALGMYHLVAEKYASAVPFLELVLQEKGEEAAVLNNLATAYGRLGDRARAIKYAERAHKIAPDNQVILENLKSLR